MITTQIELIPNNRFRATITAKVRNKTIRITNTRLSEDSAVLAAMQMKDYFQRSYYLHSKFNSQHE